MSEFDHIKQRHNERAEMTFPDGAPDSVVQEFRDVAFLLTRIYSLEKTLRVVRSHAEKNSVPGQPKTKLKAFKAIAQRVNDALGVKP